MATDTAKQEVPEEAERPSGVPAPRRLGESRREGLYVLLALLVLALMGLSFWFEATH